MAQRPATIAVTFRDEGDVVRDVRITHWIPGKVHHVVGQSIQLDDTPDWARVLPGYKIHEVVGQVLAWRA